MAEPALQNGLPPRSREADGDPLPVRSGHLEDARGRLYYEVAGAGPWVMLCHALGTDSSIWSTLVTVLRQSFTVVSFDLRGHGRSPAPRDEDYSFAAMAGDARALLNHLGCGQVTLIGLSVGGEVAQVFATQYPELTDNVILCSTACVTGEDRAELWERRIAEVLLDDRGMKSIASASVLRWFTPRFRSEHAATVQEFRNRLTELSPTVYVSMARTIQQMDLRPQIRDLNCPVLVICGAEDANTGPDAARTIVDNILSAELFVIPDTAHFPHLEAPERFHALVLDWLRKRVATA